MLQEWFALDMLKFWKELFDEKSKSEAADRNFSKFKLSLLTWKQSKEKKKCGAVKVSLASQKLHNKALLSLDLLLRSLIKRQIDSSFVADGETANWWEWQTDAQVHLLHDSARVCS